MKTRKAALGIALFWEMSEAERRAGTVSLPMERDVRTGIKFGVRHVYKPLL